MTLLPVWSCSLKLMSAGRLLFSDFIFFVCSYSLRKKPNERPAYTELMVSSLLCFLLYLSLCLICCKPRKKKKHFLISPLQQHPFFTLHDAKETDVASFVKVVLDDWWAPIRLRPPTTRVGGGPLGKKKKKEKKNAPMAYLLKKILEKKNEKKNPSSHWNDRLVHPHTAGEWAKGLTAAQQHWRVV